MLKLDQIVKTYSSGDSAVHALQGVSLEFRKNEFVSILGPSGCGKTTLLNIIGGLDRYTSGDLIINGKSTTTFKDAHWDTYRNHSIGFVFQSYNLIPHQTVLSNVELALTLSGVSKAERRQRALAALESVGLSDQVNKKPSQMSGGQMQRVAIARALVNNPDILLADEPTGALDTTTSVQIMDILKEVAKDRLVIMVTHNPELAEEYSSRIVRLSDGLVISDTNPYDSSKDEVATDNVPTITTREEKKVERKAAKKRRMSLFTALSLSLNNLLTKKGRTILTSFAGSIGIIGIALILSVSAGVNAYITSIERSTMSSYPLSIQSSTMDTSSMFSTLTEAMEEKERPDGDVVYSNDIMIKMLESISAGITTNNMVKFKNFIENESNIRDYTTDIKYSYSANLNTYHKAPDGTYHKNINSLTEMMVELGLASDGMASSSSSSSGMGGMMSGNPWSELVGNQEYIESQYDIIDGHLPNNSNQVVLIVDREQQITDYVLYTVGLRDINDLKEFMKQASDEDPNTNFKFEEKTYSFDQIYGHKFRVLLDSDTYRYDETTGMILERTDAELQAMLSAEDAIELEIVGIICPAEDSVSTSSIGCIGYTAGLMPSLIEKTNNSEVVKKQTENKEVNLMTGLPFKEYTMEELPALMEQIIAMNPDYAASLQFMKPAQILDMFSTSQEKALDQLGYVDMSNPDAIHIYPKDFESKDEINRIISDYNKKQTEEDKITYSDTVALLMNSVTTIVNAISYVLIAFVAISLIVSSIMIGIITYISVLERTKEIGILRAIGASKKDISRVFNAETLIVGFCAGAIGIGMTLIFNVIINIILYRLTEIETLKATLPPFAAIILIAISMLLTFVAGLIPSRFAAKKDPVEALRSE
ncbi:MAG: ABC transporter ATP-binding protein/permease [Ruminococcaceae bacterium]|nr:ABC transporter ATP-binding protein/permease [Oscillospiraceae bacterium]